MHPQIGDKSFYLTLTVMPQITCIALACQEELVLLKFWESLIEFDQEVQHALACLPVVCTKQQQQHLKWIVLAMLFFSLAK